jgi:LPS sulfotransferase NodH
MIPNIFVVGAQKCGTTWLHDYLESRGDICLPKGVKETFYFDRYFDKGNAWYESHFSPCEDMLCRMVLEIAPSYFSNHNAQKRLPSYAPGAKIIVMVRDPVARAWSHYLHLKRYGYTNKPLLEAVQDFPEIIESSLYEKHIDIWKNAFGEKSVLVFSFEELVRDPVSFVNHFCDAVGIPRNDKLESITRKSNEASASRNFYLAKVVNMVADYCRQRKLYFVVNFLKKIGLKKLVFGCGGAGKKKEMLSPRERRWLASIIQKKA